MALLYERCRKTTFSCKTMYNKKSPVQFLNVLNVIFMLTLRKNISKSCIQFCSLTLNFDLIFKALESAQKIWILTNFSKYLPSFSPLRNMFFLQGLPEMSVTTQKLCTGQSFQCRFLVHIANQSQRMSKSIGRITFLMLPFFGAKIQMFATIERCKD